jgi:hypothetical protein
MGHTSRRGDERSPSRQKRKRAPRGDSRVPGGSLVPEKQRQCLDEDRVGHPEGELPVLPEIVEGFGLQQGVDGRCPRFPPGGGEWIQLGREMKSNLLPAQALCLVKMFPHRGLLESQKVGCPGGPTHGFMSLEPHLHEIVDSPLQRTLTDGMDLEQ